MKIGSILFLDILNKETNETIKYESKIISKNEEYLFIDYPIQQETRKTTFIKIGTKVHATYISKDHLPYAFEAEILDRVKNRIPALAIKLPKEEMIKKVQRREYVRVPTAIDVAIHCPNESFEPFTSVSLDISGSGISVVLPNDRSLEDVKETTLWFVLQWQSGKYSYITTSAKVIRIVQTEGKAKSISLMFISITPKDKQTLIQFCFEKQRSARQQGLL